MNTNHYTQPKFTSDVVQATVLPAWSIDPVMLSGGVFQIGTVGSRVDGKVVPLDASTDEGAMAAAVIVLTDADATAATTKGAAAARGVTVLADGLVWPTRITGARKALALAALEARGIVVRQPLATSPA